MCLGICTSISNLEGIVLARVVWWCELCGSQSRGTRVLRDSGCWSSGSPQLNVVLAPRGRRTLKYLRSDTTLCLRSPTRFEALNSDGSPVFMHHHVSIILVTNIRLAGLPCADILLRKAEIVLKYLRLFTLRECCESGPGFNEIQ